MPVSAKTKSAIAEALTAYLGHPFRIDTFRPASGGSINAAYRMSGDDRDFFVKFNRAGMLEMFEAEAEGLNALHASGTIRVPEALVWGETDRHAWLVTEYIQFGRGRADTAEAFGRGLAAMHRVTAERFGWHRDNTIGSTPQPNGWRDDWIAFYRERRLSFQLELAARNGFGGSLQRKGERLLDLLPEFFTNYRPVASLLHGDLWGGNQGTDADGNPVIFDPAVYFGDREADLAMTTLFGGFSPAFYAAYNEAWPLDGGYGVRKTLYNLYHILNHANLFGSGYAGQAEMMMDQLLAEVRG